MRDQRLSYAFICAFIAFGILPSFASAVGSNGGPVGVAPFNLNANGPAAGANSTPVVEPTDQGASNANTTIPISINTATTTQLVALSSGKQILVTAWDVIAAGSGNFQLEYGTGTACATGTTILTGPYNLVAQAGLNKGNGAAPVIIVPASNALCALTSAAVQMSGSLAYQQR